MNRQQSIRDLKSRMQERFPGALFDPEKTGESILDNEPSSRRIRYLNRIQLSLTGAATVAKVLDEIRRAIERSGVSRYRISQETGIDQGQLSKLMSGEAGLSLASLEKLCEFLDLEIIVRPKRSKRSK